MAETFTDKLKLSKRDTGDLNWGQGANANMDALDQYLQQALLRPPRTVTATLGSGGVGPNLSGNTSYFYKVTAVNAAGETTEGKVPTTVEAQVTQPAVPLPIILQWETVKGATGYKIYKATSSGQEKLLASVSGESTSTYTDDGNTAVDPGVSIPLSNSAFTSVSGLTAGAGISLSPGHGRGVVDLVNSGVLGIRKLGEAAALAGDVKLEEGSNITLVQDAENGKITISAAGGAATAGYATVIVAAPTGVPATDKANIQAALDALPGDYLYGGGTVILREGTYVVDGPLNLPSKPFFIFGQGHRSTTIKAAGTGSFNVFQATAACTIREFGFFDFRIRDESAGSTGIYLAPASGYAVEGGIFENLNLEGLTHGIVFAPAAGSDCGGHSIRKCLFMGVGTRQIHLDTANADISDVSIVGCVFSNDAAAADCQVRLAGTRIVFAQNQVAIGGGADTAAVEVVNPLVGSSLTGNLIGGGAGINWSGFKVAANKSMEDCTFVGNVLAVASTATWSFNVATGGKLMNCTFAANRFSKPMVINAPAVPGETTGNYYIGNAGTITDNGGGTNYKYLTGLRKLGESAPLFGDVKLEAGSNINITQDVGNNKLTIGATTVVSGYTTALVAAPSGVPATDKAAIEAAIALLPAAGGEVLFREGTYVLDASVAIPAGKPIHFRGMGRGTVLQSGTSFPSQGGFLAGPSTSNMSGISFENMTADGTNYKYPALLSCTPNGVTHSNISFFNCHLKLTGSLLVAQGFSGTLRGVRAHSCYGEDNPGYLMKLGAPVGTTQEITVVGCVWKDTAGWEEPGYWKGTDFTFIGNTIVSSSAALTGWKAESVDRLVFAGNLIKTQKGITVLAGQHLRNAVIVGNRFQTVGNAIEATGEMSNCVISGNTFAGACVLNANANSSGNFIEGNKGTITDNSGASNTVVTTHVSGVRKLGEASALSGDVKLEQGSGITLTQDGANNKITVAAASNWKLVANLTAASGQIGPDFTGLSLATHKAYKLVFSGQVASFTAPTYLVLRTNGAANNGSFHITQQYGATQTDEAGTVSPLKLLKLTNGSGTAYEISGEILLTAPQSGSVHAICEFMLTNQSASPAESPQRGYSAGRVYHSGPADLTSLGMQGDQSNFQFQGVAFQLYEAQ